MGLKYKIAEWFICQRNRHSKGNSEIDFFKNFIVYFLGAQVYLKAYLKWDVPWYLVLLAMSGYMIMSWFFGYMWDKLGLFVIENEWSNKRNNFMKEVRKKFNIKDDRKY